MIYTLNEICYMLKSTICSIDMLENHEHDVFARIFETSTNAIANIIRLILWCLQQSYQWFDRDFVYSTKCDACFKKCNFWKFRIKSWCEQEFDSIDSIENHISIENSRSSKLTLILSEINNNIDQNECVLINIFRLNAIMLKNIDRLSKIVLQSIKYLKINNDFINWVKIIIDIVWSRSRQAICYRQVVIIRSSIANHEWIEYQTFDCIIVNATRDH